MHTLLLCLAAAAVGVDVGWERMPKGGMEYIIQLDPQTLETLRDGQPIQSDLHPEAGEVRSYRIVVGKKVLPRETPPPAAPTPKAAGSKPSDPTELKTEAPGTLPPDSGEAAILEHPAVFMESDTAASSGKPSENQPKTPAEQPAKPWMAMTVTLLGLFASVGANVFLGWIAWDSRRQFRAANSMTPSNLPVRIAIGHARSLEADETRPQ